MPSPHAQKADYSAIRGELRSLRALVEDQLSGLAWGDLARAAPHRAELLRRLLRFGVSAPMCARIAEQTDGAQTIEEAWTAALNELARCIPEGDDRILAEGGAVALVGPTGVGKTTTVAKLAAQYLLRHGPGTVRLVTTDGRRLGTQEQLRAFARILDIPLYVAQRRTELRAAVETRDTGTLLLIDTEGIGHRDARLAGHLETLCEDARTAGRYVVLAANAQASVLDEVIASFKPCGVEGCIITKLDEAAAIGGVIAALAEHGLPAHYVSDGQQVPDDLHPAGAADLVRRGLDCWRETREPKPFEESLALTFGPMAWRAAANR